VRFWASPDDEAPRWGACPEDEPPRFCARPEDEVLPFPASRDELRFRVCAEDELPRPLACPEDELLCPLARPEDELPRPLACPDLERLVLPELALAPFALDVARADRPPLAFALDPPLAFVFEFDAFPRGDALLDVLRLDAPRSLSTATVLLPIEIVGLWRNQMAPPAGV
jgi:hypothetical protein